MIDSPAHAAGSRELSGTQSAHKLHTSVLHGFGYTAATGFGIEPTCGPLSGILG